MKTRVLTGLIAMLIPISLLVLMFNTYYITIVLTIFSVIGTYELIKVTKTENVGLYVAGMIMSAAVLWVNDFNLLQKYDLPLKAIIIIYLLLLFIIQLIGFEKTRFEQVFMTFFASIAFPYALSVIPMLRDIYITYPDRFLKGHAAFLLTFSMFSAWWTDTFAFFFGSKFGKHKLVPKISPKKTYEGALAGVFLTLVINVITYFIFKKISFPDTPLFPIWILVLLSIMLSVFSIIGDLIASSIKRNAGIKDFGNLFPTHGGVVDRSDSFLVVLTVLYASIVLIERFKL